MLICFDMDGVIFKHNNFWIELHKIYETHEKGLELTKKYLKTDYPKLVEEVVNKLWKNKPESKFLELTNSLEYVEGAKELFTWLKDQGYKTAIISSGPRRLAERAKKDLNIDYIYTNELIFKDQKATGEFKWPIGADKKDEIFKKLCQENKLNPKDCIVVGHDHADLKMARLAGISIGFCPEEQEHWNFVINKRNLNEIIQIIKKI